jgi:hypothetical protein
MIICGINCHLLNSFGRKGVQRETRKERRNWREGGKGEGNGEEM